MLVCVIKKFSFPLKAMILKNEKIIKMRVMDIEAEKYKYGFRKLHEEGKI